jgi:hypothetical protein
MVDVGDRGMIIPIPGEKSVILPIPVALPGDKAMSIPVDDKSRIAMRLSPIKVGDRIYVIKDAAGKYIAVKPGGWYRAPDMNLAARYGCCGAGDTHDACFVVGGWMGSNYVGQVEKFDGTTWTTGNSMVAPRYMAGSFGTVTAGVVMCGYRNGYLNSTEKYNGTTWSTSGNTSVSAWGVMGCGTQTAGVRAGGAISNGSPAYKTHEWFDGTSWSTKPDLYYERFMGGLVGTQTAMLMTSSQGNYEEVPGFPGQSRIYPYTQIWDGEAWAAAGDAIQARGNSNAAGTVIACIAIAGTATTLYWNGSEYEIVGTAFYTSCEWYNGTSWQMYDPLSCQRTHHAAGGSYGSMFCAGGLDSGDVSNKTVEFHD